MENRIDLMFANLKAKKRKALFPFITAGYPDIKFTENLIYEMADSGVDLIEIGVPFSDPIADGPMIQEASYYALENGTNIDEIFKMVERLRKNGVKIPLVLMCYYNSLYNQGETNIASIAKNVGIDGFIVPDLLPFETNETNSFAQILHSQSLHQIFLASIITKQDRLERIIEIANGFLYLVAKVGTTGESSFLNLEQIKSKIDFIKSKSNIPVAVGFGVSNKSHVKELKNIADAIIVGSAVIKTIKETKSVPKVKDFIVELLSELR